MNKEYETEFHIECPAFKKPRTSDIVPKSMMPPMAPPNRAMSAYGNKCQFAHVPHWRGLVREDNRIGNRDYRMTNELKICRMFYSGKKCTYEDRCRFLHVTPQNVQQDLRRVSDGSSGGKRSGFGNWRSIGDRGNSKPVVWKTKLCNKWEMAGGCPFGNICYFAHGQAELQKFGGDFALKSGTVPTNNSKKFPTAKDGIGTSYRQQVQGIESIFKWKEFEKLRGIYADWIEDTPFLHSS